VGNNSNVITYNKERHIDELLRLAKMAEAAVVIRTAPDRVFIGGRGRNFWIRSFACSHFEGSVSWKSFTGAERVSQESWWFYCRTVRRLARSLLSTVLCQFFFCCYRKYVKNEINLIMIFQEPSEIQPSKYVIIHLRICCLACFILGIHDYHSRTHIC